jgi:orotate phosphoribosyltransferase
VADAAILLQAEQARLLGVVCAIWRGPGSPAVRAVPDLPVRALFTEVDLAAP